MDMRAASQNVALANFLLTWDIFCLHITSHKYMYCPKELLYVNLFFTKLYILLDTKKKKYPNIKNLWLSTGGLVSFKFWATTNIFQTLHLLTIPSIWVSPTVYPLVKPQPNTSTNVNILAIQWVMFKNTQVFQIIHWTCVIQLFILW